MDTHTPDTIVSLSDPTIDIHNPNTTVLSSPMRNIANDEDCQQHKPFLRVGPSLVENMADKEILRIGTLNVKNIESNTAYVSELLKTCDISAV